MDDDFFADDDNIFSDDEALDFMIFEELEKENREKISQREGPREPQPQGGSGCLAVFLLILIPIGMYFI